MYLKKLFKQNHKLKKAMIIADSYCWGNESETNKIFICNNILPSTESLT